MPVWILRKPVAAENKRRTLSFYLKDSKYYLKCLATGRSCDGSLD